MSKTENTQIPVIKNEIPVPQKVQKPAILGQQKQAGMVNGKRLAYNINLLFIAFIVCALILDFAFASKLNILHLRGKHFAHILFLGFISLGILFILKKGAIL